MTPRTLKESIAEAERFLRAAKKARDAINPDSYGGFTNFSVTASAKRASMDLTKALSAMRACNYPED